MVCIHGVHGIPGIPGIPGIYGIYDTIIFARPHTHPAWCSSVKIV